MTTNGSTIPLPNELTTPPACVSQTGRGKCGSRLRTYVASGRTLHGLPQLRRSEATNYATAVELEARSRVVRLAETFVISRDSSDEAEVVEVELRHEGVSGFGEGTPIERYDEDAASAVEFLEECADMLGDDPFALDEI